MACANCGKHRASKEEPKVEKTKEEKVEETPITDEKYIKALENPKRHR